MAGDTRVQVFIIYSIHIVCFLQEWGVPINMGMLMRKYQTNDTYRTRRFCYSIGSYKEEYTYVNINNLCKAILILFFKLNSYSVCLR